MKMPQKDIYRAANVVACTVAETEQPTPAGVIYAGLQTAGITKGEFDLIMDTLKGTGLVEILQPGFLVKGTRKLQDAHAAAKAQGRTL